MPRLALSLALVIAATTTAHAGPWPRGAGGVFLAPKLLVTDDWRGAELYGEYGYSDRLSFGGKLQWRDDDIHTAELFSRWHLHDLGGAHPVSVEFGTTARFSDAIEDRIPRATGALHFGMGFERPWQGGWLSLSLRGTQPPPSDTLSSVIVDLDAELGLRPIERAILSVRVEQHFAGGERYATVVPGAGWEVTGAATLMAQGTFDVTGDAEPGLRLALWLDF